MSHNAWNNHLHGNMNDDSLLNCVFFVSRNKDNRDVNGFKERRLTFLTTHSVDNELIRDKFNDFVNDGRSNELSRMYVAINKRSQMKSKAEFLHYLVDHPDMNVAAYGDLTVKSAMKYECAAEKHRLLDVDTQDETKLNELVSDLHERHANIVTLQKTIHGFAIVIERGADLRELINTSEQHQETVKWPTDLVTYKCDDLLLYNWKTNLDTTEV